MRRRSFQYVADVGADDHPSNFEVSHQDFERTLFPIPASQSSIRSEQSPKICVVSSLYPNSTSCVPNACTVLPFLSSQGVNGVL
jgi:hypothetical protein